MGFAVIHPGIIEYIAVWVKRRGPGHFMVQNIDHLADNLHTLRAVFHQFHLFKQRIVSGVIEVARVNTSTLSNYLPVRAV